MRHVTTPELREGDIVVTHGLRCYLDSAPKLSKAHPGDSTFYVQALVLNRDEVPNEVVPVAWTADWDRRRSRHAQLPHDGVHRWTIQGNELARWAVE